VFFRNAACLAVLGALTAALAGCGVETAPFRPAPQPDALERRTEAAAAQTAPAIVQTGTPVFGKVASGSFTLTPSLPKAPSAADVLRLVVYDDAANSAVATPAGWTAGPRDVLSGATFAVFYRTGTTAASVAVTLSGTNVPYGAAVLQELTGVAIPPNGAAVANLSFGAATTMLGPTLTVTPSNGLVLATWAWNDAGRDVGAAAPSGWAMDAAADSGPVYAGLALMHLAGTASSGTAVRPAVTTTGASYGNVTMSAIVEVLAPAPDAGVSQSTAAPTSAPATPKPTPSPPPTPSPTPKPTPSPTPAPAIPYGIVNGQAWPAGVVPYGPTSPWNRALANPDAPPLMASSATIIASAFANDPQGSGLGIRTQEPGPSDGTRPVYFATASDPVIHTACQVYCGAGHVEAGDIHIPAKARPAQGGDHHIAVVQPNGTELDFWEASQSAQSYAGAVTRDWTAGDTLTYGSGGSCGSFTAGTGFAVAGATAAGACLAGGTIRTSDLAAGAIRHATAMIAACVGNGAWVYPATGAVTSAVSGTNWTCTGTPSSHVPLGARIWSDLTDAQVAALGVSALESAYLVSLHHYGAYVIDEGGCGSPCAAEGPLVGILSLDPPQEAWSYGNVPPGNTYAAAHNWTVVPAAQVGGSSARYIFRIPWNPAGINWSQHLHVLDPCTAKGTC